VLKFLTQKKADGTKDADIGDVLVEDAIIPLMKELRVPNGLKALGYKDEDIPDLVEGTLPQHRVTKLSPRPVGREELTQLFQNSMSYY